MTQPVVGVVGWGQLARMMHPAAVALDVRLRVLAEAADPAARRSELVKEYRERHLNPYVAAESGFVDDVIDPADTRTVLVRSLALLRSKHVARAPRKHGNVPL